MIAPSCDAYLGWRRWAEAAHPCTKSRIQPPPDTTAPSVHRRLEKSIRQRTEGCGLAEASPKLAGKTRQPDTCQRRRSPPGHGCAARAQQATSNAMNEVAPDGGLGYSSFGHELHERGSRVAPQETKQLSLPLVLPRVGFITVACFDAP